MMIPDGLEALRAEIELVEIMKLIERTARWVDPETFRLLPVWFPEFARRKPFYKTNWSEPQMNKSRSSGDSVHKVEMNTNANMALTLALGLTTRGRTNWSCCHIWGVDDPFFQTPNAVVSDHRFYSCVANMVLLPTPLKAFTDSMPEVKAMLRICARNTYGWQCDHADVESASATLDEWSDWSAYPASWPRSPGEGTPPGVVPLNAAIGVAAAKRLQRIRHDLQNAGEYYPRTEVREALAYWRIPEHTSGPGHSGGAMAREWRSVCGEPRAVG